MVRHAGANATPVVRRAGAGTARQASGARLVLVRRAPGVGTPPWWRWHAVRLVLVRRAGGGTTVYASVTRIFTLLAL